MSLSENVKESLNEAEGNLRNALYKAAKNERASTLTAISRMISELRKLESFEDIQDMIEENIDRHKEEE